MNINRDRMLKTAFLLMSEYSPTGNARGALDALADFLKSEGFEPHRHDAGHPSAPAVSVRLHSGRPGPVLQFNGHVDTVHLPFVPPSIDGGLLKGSGASDMKGGTAAAVEALLALRDAGTLQAGSVLLTAHDLHEAPWGDGLQLDTMIREGVVGDAVLLPEPLSGHLPVVGRGQACWSVVLSRPGPSIHEVMRPMNEPSVIAAGAELVRRLGELDKSLATQVDPLAGRASVFVGLFHGGEIFNGFPHDARMEGTRRWLPGGKKDEVEKEFRAILAEVEASTGVTIETKFRLVRDAFALDESDPFVGIFNRCYQEVSGKPLQRGPKPFVDDGNSFWSLGDIPAITHGPLAGGQHTIDEWASIDDMVRVATLYAKIAAEYCVAGD